MTSKSRTASGLSPRKAGTLDFTEIVAKLASWKFPDKIDGVVAIAHDGIVPGVMVAQRLNVGLKTITIHYRDETNEPQFAQPQLVSSVPGLGGWRRVLLVDDVWLTGNSWNAARTHLSRNIEVLPFVMSGDTDFALFRGSESAVQWPWNA